MLDTPFGRVIIPTHAHAMLSDVLDTVVETAGLAIVRGPVGIGKTFALEREFSRLRTEGVMVVEVTVTPEIEGSIGSFLRAVLTPYRHLGGSAVQAREALANILLSAYPFLEGYQKCVFVVDEAQGLKSNNLEVLRGLYDLGDAARNGNAHSPAFGLVLVGNDTFLNKGGRHQKAEFRPLMSRVMINLMLSRPDKVELSNLARGLLPENIEAQAILVQFGSDAGSLRAIDKAHRLAMSFVENGDDLLVALRRAVSLSGGR